MVGKLSAIVLAVFVTLCVPTAWTQENSSPPDPSQAPEDGKATPPTPTWSNKRNPQDRQARQGAESATARRVFEQLPAEDKQRVKENLKRWKDMPPEERDAMRLQEQQRRQKMLHETEASIEHSGLKLDADQHQVYVLRYAQERRKIEQKLRKEMEEKRKPLLEEMSERLKAEFSASPAASPAPKP